MKYLFAGIWLFFSLGCTVKVHAQQKKHRRPPPPPSATDLPVINMTCYPLHHYSLTQRLQNYPFNKASGISLVSFRSENAILVAEDSVAQSATENDVYASLPEDNRSSCKSVYEERVLLNAAQTDSLTHILYDYDYQEADREGTGIMGPITQTGCYYPHNAILFHNARGKVFAFIELCFTCGGSRLSDKKIKTGVPCEGRYDLIRSFFKTCGIKTGITLIPRLPEEILAPQLILK